MATAGRWKQRDADRLADVYRSAGLTDLVQSKKYGAALNIAREGVQAQVRRSELTFSRDNCAQLISRCIAGLTITEPALRSMAESLGAIMRKVDAELEQMKRLPGRIVRHDGQEALVVVDTGEQEELRSVHSGYLKSLGLQERGAPFVLHEFSWSPDTKMSMFIPALDLEETAFASADLENELANAEEPLPYPAAV